MRLLITTQVVDRTDPFLGFFHGWIVELAKHFEHIEIICLQEGQHSLPSNVNVNSLGKELGIQSRIVYAARFLGLVWKLRDSYDAVFVHMNQEYILLAGWLWKILHKRIFCGAIIIEGASLRVSQELRAGKSFIHHAGRTRHDSRMRCRCLSVLTRKFSNQLLA